MALDGYDIAPNRAEKYCSFCGHQHVEVPWPERGYSSKTGRPYSQMVCMNSKCQAGCDHDVSQAMISFLGCSRCRKCGLTIYRDDGT